MIEQSLKLSKNLAPMTESSSTFIVNFCKIPCVPPPDVPPSCPVWTWHGSMDWKQPARLGEQGRSDYQPPESHRRTALTAAARWSLARSPQTDPHSEKPEPNLANRNSNSKIGRQVLATTTTLAQRSWLLIWHWPLMIHWFSGVGKPGSVYPLCPPNLVSSVEHNKAGNQW